MSKIDTNILKKLRKSKNVTQSAIAEELHIGRTSYTKIENGIQDADTDTIAKLADYFNVSIDYLLGRPEPTHEATPADLQHIYPVIYNTMKKYKDTPEALEALEQILEMLPKIQDPNDILRTLAFWADLKKTSDNKLEGSDVSDASSDQTPEPTSDTSIDERRNNATT